MLALPVNNFFDFLNFVLSFFFFENVIALSVHTHMAPHKGVIKNIFQQEWKRALSNPLTPLNKTSRREPRHMTDATRQQTSESILKCNLQHMSNTQTCCT